MDRRYFYHEIEDQVNFEISEFLANALPEDESDREDAIRKHWDDKRRTTYDKSSFDVFTWDMGEKLWLLTRFRFYKEVVQAHYNTRTDELLHRLFLLRDTRNRYAHRNPSDTISEAVELADLCNLIALVDDLISYGNTPSLAGLRGRLQAILLPLRAGNSSSAPDPVSSSPSATSASESQSNTSRERLSRILQQSDDIRHRTENKRNQKLAEDLEAAVVNAVNSAFGRFAHRTLPNGTGSSATELGTIRSAARRIEESLSFIKVMLQDALGVRTVTEKSPEPLPVAVTAVEPRASHFEPDIFWFNSTDARDWLALAGYTKRNNLLSGADRHHLYALGRIRADGRVPELAILQLQRPHFEELLPRLRREQRERDRRYADTDE